jgi:hypothetical protein
LKRVSDIDRSHSAGDFSIHRGSIREAMKYRPTRGL